jgi:hypothetical protein
MASVPVRRVGVKRRRVLPVEELPDWSKLGWRFPPSGKPPPVPEVPEELWGIAYGRVVERELDGALWDMAVAMLALAHSPRRRRRRYLATLAQVRVPGSALKDARIGESMRRWTPPLIRWQGSWAPGQLFALALLAGCGKARCEHEMLLA